MRAGTRELKLVAGDAVDQKPIRFDMRITKGFPIAFQEVILIAWWQLISGQ